ncbi:hypothetical protein [Bacteroides fragilis]|uniref:hypothetical protein n=1 Tax=Bacteroides fragilis TaxID=817 RepID=UPI0028127EDC|nr:hypothetical protein [Bacteroides fragilis]WMI93614.1 hypothetical protein BFGS084_01017 [Bacteroides fragilis]
MQKISSIIAVMAGFLMSFASCTNEELVPNEPDGPVLNQGRVVFNVNTGKSMVYTRASKDDEQAIRSLGVFIVKPDGNLAEGITRFYEAKDMRDKKLAVSIPVDIMETSGVKAYLVANGPDKTQCDGLKTEQEVLGLVATTKPEEISTKGIPMASGAISLNFTGGIATVDANMKRVMSTLYAKVVKSKGVVVGPSDFTFKVHGVSGKEGYCFKDECKDTGVEKVWNSTSKSQEEEVSLGYFYQSKAFQVEVVSQSTAQSRTVEIPLEKAQTRNKKYVLKIHPKPASEGKGEFTVTVEAWDATETDVDFEGLSIKQDLPADRFEKHNGGIRLLTNNYFKTDFGSPKDWFVLKEGSKIVNVKLEGTIDGEKRGVDLNEKGIACATSRLNQTDLSGKIIVTIEDKNGIITHEDCTIYVPHANIWWNDRYFWERDKTNCKIENGEFVYTAIDISGKKESFSASADPTLSLAYSSETKITNMKALQSSQNGVLYNEKDEPVSVNDAVMDVEYDSNRFSIGLKCKALVPYYGYIKVTLKKQDNSEVTQVLKIRFK